MQVVSAQWLADRLEDPQIAIVDCRFSLADPARGEREYRESHIPGAYYLNLDRDLSAPIGPHGGRHPLPDPATFARKLEAMGIEFDRTTVVAYDDSKMAFAARLRWLLGYLGHDRASILDGGWSGWRSLDYPATETLPPAKSGSFSPQIREERIVNIETVKARKDLPQTLLIDSRDRDRYLGRREPIDPIAGHIPGAVNFPWQEVCNREGYIKPQDEQERRWQNLPATDELMLYCGSGVTACVNLLSLEMAGIDSAKLYAGGWSDWCSYSIREG
ncbi:MAG: sulfurtransferase [Cyanobacteria bacterium SBLK]|nr:sulfurtransferase [Cyanobacteria bacterium SBLK]